MSDCAVGRTLRQVIERASVLALLLLSPLLAAAHAQSAEDYRRQVQRLEPEWRAARAAVEAKERSRREAARSVSLQFGVLRLIVDSALVPVVSGPAAVAGRMLDATFGDAARIISAESLVVRSGVLRGTDTTRVIFIGARGREVSFIARDSGGVRRHVIDLLTGSRTAAPLHATLDDGLRNWMRAPLTAGRESSAERERMYIELVTASTNISRRCLAGEVLGCRELLGFAPVQDPLLDGHTAVQRRAMAIDHRRRLRTTGRTRQYDRCREDHDDDSCIALLRTLPGDAFFRSIASNEMRRSFVRSVLERGGDHAYDRLRAQPNLPLDARFAAAGGASFDSLVVGWQARLLAARPQRTPVTPVAALATLAWIAAAGALSLRSSRWR